MKSDIREQQERDGIIYPGNIPSCVTLYVTDYQLTRKAWYKNRKLPKQSNVIFDPIWKEFKKKREMEE